MANTSNSDKWYFTKEQLESTPSRKCGFDAHKELSYRQQAANFIQDMGQRLKVSQLCINTAIVYMHRFYVFHSFTHFPWYQMAAAALFLAAKVEEQPRKLEYVIRVANMCRNVKDVNIDVTSEKYLAQSQDLVFNENVLLQTLGFDVAIDHPHTHVVRCCHLVRASKDLAQTSYFMASNSLHLTTMCIQYKPTVVACFCILVACKWSNWEIPLSNEKKEWFKYVDPTVTAELLQQLTEEFLVIFEACPSRLKEKIMAIADNVAHIPSSLPGSTPFDNDPKKIVKDDSKSQHPHRPHEHKMGPENDPHKHRSRPHEAGSSSQQQRERDRNHDRDRLVAQQKVFSSTQNNKVPHLHHRPPLDQKMKPHSRPPSMGGSSGSSSSNSSGYLSGNRVEPRDILREAAKDSPFGLANKEFRDTVREHAKDPNVVRSSELQKRDYLLKPNIQMELNSSNNYSDNRLSYNVDKQRIDQNQRSKIDPSKLAPVNKHDSVRKSEEHKPYFKLADESIKKQLSVSTQDKNNTYLNKPVLSTSQKTKSPFDADPSKSVLKPNSILSSVPPKPQPFNGSASDNAYINKNSIDPPFQIKNEPLESKEEPLTPPVVKRPSLFSPEQTPPYKKEMKLEKLSPILDRKPDTPVTPAFSPFSSPIAVMRDRNHSTSSSEPELRPVMKKIDQVEGFENIMRDNTIGINKISQVPDMIASLPLDKSEVQEEPENDVKLQEIQLGSGVERGTSVNGLETNPTIISNLLKETPALPHLTATTTIMNTNGSDNSLTNVPLIECKAEKEHHHHKSKKKNKEKHKHKDKSKEDKEKKKKHKDKDRDRHKRKDKHQDLSEPTPVPAEPIKLKIQKDRIQPIPETTTSCTGLKIKIPKDKIKTESINELTQQSLVPLPLPTIGIKLKIPKDKLNNCISLEQLNPKKREREKSSPTELQPSKMSKTSHKDSKQNGRHSYNKVSKNIPDPNTYYVQNFTPPPQYMQNNYMAPPPRHPPPIMGMDPMRPPPPNPSMYFFSSMGPPPPPPHTSLPNLSIPPPNYMYTYYPSYSYPSGFYRQPPPMPSKNVNPPLPTEAPPTNIPPPPPPEPHI